jgi:hypothetical protein
MKTTDKIGILVFGLTGITSLIGALFCNAPQQYPVFAMSAIMVLGFYLDLKKGGRLTMCTTCGEYRETNGDGGCPACGFNGTEREPVYEEIECPECNGEGTYYLSLSRGKYIEKSEYKSLSLYEKRDIEVEECERCKGLGTIEKEIR